ncbi:Calcineurin-binding protein cabin-1 [Orchesella cincta]|uniref:Calcineurin-binding protein cabin-1 n=1 Tax=Orchesella cincta TaxID=48709 RepID=A0A1D2MTA3_ORCCI|nr:Calcineurin-binding protein cabin-1 [Orchesella cincta]
MVFVEIVTEKYKIELASGDKTFLELADNEIFFLDDCLSSTQILPTDFILRVKWLTVRRFLQMASTSNDEEANNAVSIILAEIEHELHQHPVTIWTVNENANLICLESVSEKSAGIAKMQNSQIITDLYQTQQYESLIGVLESCINFSEIEKRDLEDVLHYTVSLFKTFKPECIHQCLNLINQAIRFQDNSILAESLVLLEDIWEKMMSHFSIQYKRSTVGSLLKILVSCERKPPPQESILSVPWCILHSVLFSLEREEPAFYLEEDTVPNSVLLLQMAHECISRSEKCCMDNGKLLLYTMKATLGVKKLEEYFGYDETRNCMEQAIFCLYSHPSKKSKVKNLKDHNAPGIILSWKMCPLLYNYYCPDELPEFDSYGSIGAEVEALFQRLLEIVPLDLMPTDRQKEIQAGIDTCEETSILSAPTPFPKDLQHIYYLIGDYYFKSKEWSKAVTYYTWDLAVNPTRFDSWAAIALSLGETINTTLNTVDVIDFKDILKQAQSTAHCFQTALQLQPSNMKLRIEFGSFVYAMHAYCSRLMKQHAADMDMDLFHMIEKAKEDFLNSSYGCFELIAKNSSSNKSSDVPEDEIWIHHYMLGKIYEKKLFEDESKEFLVQYELAGKLLHDQNAPYPSKMNYYSPPELAIEALEVYYRIHATILSMVEKIDYSFTKEKFYLEYIRRQENSPFMKCKQSKGDGGEGKKGRKSGAEETVSRKDMAEISALVNHLVDETVKRAELTTAVSSDSSGTSSTSTEDDTSTDSTKSVKPGDASNALMSSYSLSEFRKRLQEKELREEKLATEAKICENRPPSPPVPVEEVDIYEGLGLDKNPFYEEFKDVKFASVIAMCLKAMEECISRYPSHFKSYYRLAHTYIVFLKDAKRAKEYLMGSPTLSQRKITGLFGDKKPTNFFNGIWRNPIDDIDRPGSFSYHMNKIMQLLLQVLSQLNDHQLLADIVLQLTKVPDNEKKYLSNPDREQFCQVALNNCLASARRKCSDAGVNYQDLGIEVFETYTKLQKYSPRLNPMGSVLHDIYKLYLKATGVNDESVTIEHAVRFFNLHVAAMKATTARVAGKNSLSMNPSDQQRGGEGGAPRKRGRRSLRQSSQETATNVQSQLLENLGQELDVYNAVSAAFQARNFFEAQKQSAALTSALTATSTASLYPTINMDLVQSALNPLFGLKNPELIGKMNIPTAHDSSNSRSTYSPFVPTTSVSKTAKQSSSGNYMAVNFAGNNKNTTQIERQSEKDRESPGSNLPKSTKLKQTARKSTMPTVSKQDKYPPPTAPQPIRINTSPFKTQTTAVEQPPQFSFNKTSNTNRSTDAKTPPLAHYHPTPKQKEITPETDTNVEVIDLTVKTPEKEKISSSRQMTVTPPHPSVTISVVPTKVGPPSRPTGSSPALTKPGVSSLPKPVVQTASPKPGYSGMSPRPNNSAAPPRQNVTPTPTRPSMGAPTLRPSMAAIVTRTTMSSPRSSPNYVTSPATQQARPCAPVTPSRPTVPVASSRPTIPVASSRPTVPVSSSRPTVPPTSSRPTVSPASSRPSVPTVQSRPSVLAAAPRHCVPVASVSVSSGNSATPGPPKMKAASNIRQQDNKKLPYPLPPKKKHHQMVFRSVTPEELPDGSAATDDVEVIILD